MIKSILVVLLSLTIHTVKCQEITSGNSQISINKLYTVVDTIVQHKDDIYSKTININWMDSLIQIRYTQDIVYDLEYARRYRRDSTYVPRASDTSRFVQLRKDASQNCHSYALEKYFNSIGLKGNILFTEWTVLSENIYMDHILSTAFTKINSFKPKRNKCKSCVFEEGSIIVLRNKWQSPSHTIYYDGKFHSKYGAFPMKIDSSIDLALKQYFDTTLVEEYRIDLKKVNEYITNKTKM